MTTAQSESGQIKFRRDLATFKEEYVGQGWEEDEIDEWVAEAYEKFPWYKYRKEENTSWIWKVWNFFLVSAIIYLACGAYLAKNRRLRKNIQDKIFDLQVQYQQVRLFRFLSLPVTQVFRMQRLTAGSCLLGNPFFKEGKPDCNFCVNNTALPLSQKDKKPEELLKHNEIFKLDNVDGYSDVHIGFKHIKNIFSNHSIEMDDSICKIYFSQVYRKMSDFFDLSEEDVKERNLSIGWKNCEGYGTRFYRKLLTRPPFASNTSEIHLEKYFFILQPNLQFTFDSVGEVEGHSYIYQAQGEATFSFYVPTECHDDCVEEPIKVNLKEGEVAVFPNNGWKFFADTFGDELSIVFLSSFVD